MIDITILQSGSSGNCYLVDDGQTRLLLECGIPFKKIQLGLKHRIHSVAGCLVSHEHGDHIKAARDLMYHGVDLYTSPGTVRAMGLTGHRTHEIVAGKQSVIGTWTVSPFRTVHDAAEPLGFILESGDDRLLYLTDSAYSPTTFPPCTAMMVECNYALGILKENVKSGSLPMAHKNRVMRSHMSISTLRELLIANDLSRCREIILMHLSDGNSDERAFKTEIEGLTGIPVRVA